ncbi:MAG TPA: putative Ig domain-containing protein, partial [Verrucomicrobiae bacterium]|nr:putative Ig domain-containing protein [Verrucomicrobiae bacterium]
AAQDGAGNMFITFSDNQGPNTITDGRVVKLNLSTLAATDVTPIKHSGEQGGYGGVSVDRQNTNIVVLSTIDRWWSPAPYAPWDQIYRSTNSGATWVETMPATLPGSTSAPWSVARSPHWADDVEIDPFNSNRVFFVTGYGVIGTTNMTVADSNGSVNWVFNSDGLEETVPLGLASPPSGANLLSAHGDIGGFRHFNVDVSPPLADYFSSHRGTSYGIDFAQGNPNFIARLFSGTPYGCYSTDGGSSWSDFVTAPPTIGNGVGNLAVSADGTRIVWMPQSSVAYYSANNGATWTASTGGPTATRVPVADRVNGNKFYIYNGTQMYVSTNGGATYGLGGTTTSSGGGPPCAVFGNEGHVLLPLGNGLWRSTNSGTNFTQFSTVQSASYVSVGKAAAGQSYPAIFILGQIGGVSGIYRSDDQGTNWVRINDNQHQFGLSWVHSFCADPRVYGRVYFGTEGRGVIYGDLLPANTPPTFQPIADQTVNVGQTVAFTSSATDSDTPAQTLTFSLLSGPAGALLDTNIGAFSWRPPVTAADSTNPVSLQVADNGTPSMSATQSFNVIVNPLTLPTLGSFSLSAGQFSFQVNGDTGPDYEIQSSSNLVDWVSAFTTNSPAMPFNWTDPSAGTSPSLFYRIVVGPPLP